MEKQQIIENNLKENARFYNNTDFTVEHVVDNTYNINWEAEFIDGTDIDEIKEFYNIDMIEVATDGTLIICIADPEELPF